MTRVISALLLLVAFSSMIAFQPSPASHLADPFTAGWMLADTNSDGVIDSVAGKIVVPDHPTAAQNAAAADIAARVGFATTGLTPPVVISAAEDRGDGPRIFIGGHAFPHELGADEGAVFEIGGNVAIDGHDEGGLLAAAEAYASRAPFIWRIDRERIAEIAGAVGENARVAGVTYRKGKIGINRVFLEGAISKASLEAALNNPKLASVHELIAGGNSAVSLKAQANAPAAPGAEGAAEAPANAAEGPARLDLAALYTMRGLFRGTPRMPIPQNLDGQLYVPEGRAGIAMANLAARMGLETTGITLPLATPATGAAARDIRTKSVVTEDSGVGKEAARKLAEEDTVAREAETPLAPGQGELRVVDKAFGTQAVSQPAVLARGDEAGASDALHLLADHFPNLWEQGKQYLSVEEIRYDLHRFFSLRSPAGQAAATLYRIDNWAESIPSARDVEARVFVDVADPGLKDLIRAELKKKFGASDAKVEVASLHAGTQCCEKLPALHYREPGYTFHQGKPAFVEDLVIPWEGTRLLNAVKGALPKLKPGEPLKMVARVSEGPEERKKLTQQVAAMLPKASAVEVLCAFKPGVSWLMDEIAPQLKGKPVASMKIEFKKDVDPSNRRVMFSPARWVQELYPVDEMLSKELGIPLEKITLDEFDPAPKAPTYRVHAYDAGGREILSREFTVATVDEPYNGVMKEYETVQVDTGWVRMESGSTVVLDQRIPTDIEQFWDHYQNQTLPKIFRSVMATYHGELRPEFVPPFDTLRIDIHMSEPSYELGIDKERISSLEALQEDTFYSTENFVNMMGDLEAGRALNYVGRIIPIVHAPEDGKDGHVHIEFYSKPAGNPMVELRWTDAAGKHHERRRDLWVLNGAMEPRLIQARTGADAGPESLTWMLAADFKDDRFDDWIKLEAEDQVLRGIFPVEQARGQLHWLEAMHAAGMYRDEIAYPRLNKMSFEFELPRALTVSVDSPAPREFASIAIQPPATPRPMIADSAKPLNRQELVQWDEPIPPSENAAILAKLAEHPGVNVYWMGRSYLGENLWAADVMLPSPSTLRSWAKETTLKASIVYSGRQHANEVSSTSHILKLGEQLVDDPATRAMLKQVNVVLHPITNADGSEMSVQLAEITPNNMLHPGYHGSLAADVSTGQTEIDPVYPESRTRRQLLESWLPDAFLNPHGYPSHEWIQPFSEYSGWVTNRQGANTGRTWWIPRGWFTSLTYLRDDAHPYSEKITYELRDRIVEAERKVPGLLDLEARMNARYERFGQRWQPENLQQPIVKGIRIYMALKGAGGGRGGAGAPAPGSGGVGGISPDVTWDSGYTEAPDETAHGDYMKLMASAGLAFDRVHLEYLGNAKLRIRRTGREQAGKITWRVERLRPNLPGSETEPRREGEAATSAQR
ncbi:MAG TPA: M14 family zinc carboxypeptidase [Bryobacteraceae bacterium]|nr:M14 family zinc carboxypeptidase [Bryobacteraceae bacterium]